jgi:hypothetical protein
MFVKANNGVAEKFPYTIGELRRDNPDTSFPKTISDSLLADFGVFTVSESAMPSYDPMTQSVERAALPTLVNGVWAWGWDVTALTAEQIAARDAAKAASIRRERDSLLAATDWTALSDVTMSAEMATYRQALRDITAQAGFPHSVNWPAKP